MRRVLMVAFHFPPLSGSSGMQRTLRFAQHLPRFGWEPLVLTAKPMAYPQTRDDLLADIPPGMVVKRAWAFDCARHFSIFGRYPAAWARPDRWASWRLDAVRMGLQMIRDYRVDAIWSTYPIATAQVIGGQLARESKLPWVADFRDPMAQEGYPADPKTWAQWAHIEHSALKHAAASVFVARGAREYYRQRYPALDARRWQVIENGFDEDSFHPAAPREPLDSSRLTLLHSGVVYPDERDPRPLFEAIARHAAHWPRFVLRLRASGHEAFLTSLIAHYGIARWVELAPPIPYRQALIEMQRADGLVVMQAKNCNAQIPAKIYEYLRAARPLIAFTHPEGDTADLMRRAHGGQAAPIADLAQSEQIASALGEFLHALACGTAALPLASFTQSASRLERSRQLADLLTHLKDDA